MLTDKSLNRLKRFAASALICMVGTTLGQAIAGSSAAAFTTDSAGGFNLFGSQITAAHNNHQPGLGINYIVATQGVFPSRSADTGEPQPSGANPYLGEISMFAGNFAPRGWAFADGQLLPISSNQALFSIFGTTYGGDGRTTFALPDLRGRSAMHYGNGPGLSNYNLGAKGGADSVALTLNQMPQHVHKVNNGFPVTSLVGGTDSHNNIKPYQAINYQIAMQGLYPSRSADTGDPSTNSINPYLGFLQMFGGNFTVRGWAQTNGQLLPISQNTALFSLLGTTYGGDGRTTFALPDLRGRLVAHEGHGPGLSDRDWGEKYGVENVFLNKTNLPNHNHGSIESIAAGSSAAIASNGGGVGHENMQPTNTLNYVIALQGLFPSRSADTTDPQPSNDADPFLGEVAMFAGNFAPRGWAFADGQLLPISQYSALFSILGTTYGGDGRTTFALPDLRGRVPVHVGGSTGPGLRPWSLGEKYGGETEVLDLTEIPPHTHEYFLGDMNGDGSLTNADISAFVLALTDPAGYASAFPGLNPDLLGDFTGDDLLTNGDISAFVAALTNSPVPAPEPTSLALIGVAGLLTLRRR